jgi:hypothetical protein
MGTLLPFQLDELLLRKYRHIPNDHFRFTASDYILDCLKKNM